MSEAPVVSADYSPIIAAAVQATPRTDGETEAQWRASVEAKARDIFLMSGPNSLLSKRLSRLAESVPVYGTMVSVAKSAGKDNRAIIVIDSGTSRATEGLAEGQESFRTDWLDDQAARDLANYAHSLIGERVRVFKYMEAQANGSGHDARVAVHVEPAPERKPRQ